MERLEDLREVVDVGGVETEDVGVPRVGEASHDVPDQRLPLPRGQALPQLVLQKAVLVVQLVHLFREQSAARERYNERELFRESRFFKGGGEKAELRRIAVP